MTGIAGLYCASGVSPSLLAAMMEVMADRAKDGHDIWLPDAGQDPSGSHPSSVVGLGAALLRTTAEAREENQPHRCEDDRIALVFDGYLTNWEELRRELLDRGAALRNRSDPELVLRAYQEWGEDCARHLDGEFAFGIIDLRMDMRSPKIVCGRDHQGLRPLFYHYDGERLLFASDLAAIVTQIVPKPKPNLDYLAGVMADKWYAREATPWQGVKRLLPAHSLCLADGRLSLAEHWLLSTDVTIRYPRDEDYLDHYRELLTDCVRRTSRSNAPLGISVSGGLDSSSLYCLAHRLAEQGNLPAPSLHGFTLAGEPASPAYELPYARAAAHHVGGTLVEVPLTRPPLDWYTEQARITHDIPIPTNGAMTIGLEQAAEASGCRALMGGDGGDEWLQGSVHYYREYTEAGDVTGFWRSLRRDAGAKTWRRALPIALRHMMMTILPEPVRVLARDYKRCKARKRADYLYWLKDALKDRLAELEGQYIADLPSDPVRWSKLNLVRSPGADMANTMMQAQYARAGLEPRNPMLTKAFIEFSAATPEHIRMRAGQSKFVHRQAMRGIVPQVILDRQTKADFPSGGTDQQFAQFVGGIGASSLGELCDADGLARLIRPDVQGQIDDDRSWEVWGVYACAAFLYHHA